ncbi:MAG: ParB/RepB/Spo0J family partition protein [Pseudomonadota bacterium]
MNEAVQKPRGQRLGRGLSALLADAPTDMVASAPDRAGGAKELPIEAMVRSAKNPRSDFAEDALDDLAASISAHGIMQPIVVREVAGHYEIIAGERRWRAAQRAGLHTVPVTIREVSDGDALQMAIIENVQRADLNAVEEARGYKQLVDEFGHSHDEIAKTIGKSRSHVANTVRLLNLPPSVQASVADGSLSPGHARALLGSPDPEAAADAVIARGLTVRATEALVAAEHSTQPAGAPPIENADTRALVKRLSQTLGLKVSVSAKADESGSLTIKYTTLEQLDSVCAKLGVS